MEVTESLEAEVIRLEEIIRLHEVLQQRQFAALESMVKQFGGVVIRERDVIAGEGLLERLCLCEKALQAVAERQTCVLFGASSSECLRLGLPHAVGIGPQGERHADGETLELLRGLELAHVTDRERGCCGSAREAHLPCSGFGGVMLRKECRHGVLRLGVPCVEIGRQQQRFVAGMVKRHGFACHACEVGKAGLPLYLCALQVTECPRAVDLRFVVLQLRASPFLQEPRVRLRQLVGSFGTLLTQLQPRIEIDESDAGLFGS